LIAELRAILLDSYYGRPFVELAVREREQNDSAIAEPVVVSN